MITETQASIRPAVGQTWEFCGRGAGAPPVVVKIRRITHEPDEVWTARARYWLPEFIETHRPYDGQARP